MAEQSHPTCRGMLLQLLGREHRPRPGRRTWGSTSRNWCASRWHWSTSVYLVSVCQQAWGRWHCMNLVRTATKASFITVFVAIISSMLFFLLAGLFFFWSRSRFSCLPLLHAAKLSNWSIVSSFESQVNPLFPLICSSNRIGLVWSLIWRYASVAVRSFLSCIRLNLVCGSKLHLFLLHLSTSCY